MTTTTQALDTPVQRLEAAYLVLRDEPGRTAAQVGEAIGLEADGVRAALGKKINRFALLASERNPKEQQFPSAVLEEVLRKADATLPEDVTLTAVRYSEIREASDSDLPAVATIMHRYGSWRRALDSAGVKHSGSNRVYERKWTEDAMTLAVADGILATLSSSFRGYEEWAKGRDDVPAQVRITSDRSWIELASDAYKEFAEGGRRRTKYQKALSDLVKERRAELSK